ncbi:MAG: glycosyltransferase family 4 protein, partial [Gammaproteobacteria bacterium]|nr:glycosyltransferase family 4 protein [Gammaproteobacteria bacterium]
EKEEIIDKIRVIKLCRQEDGLPILRFFYPRWTSLVTAMSKADSDIYLHNCGESITGQIAIWCKLRSKKFLFSLASNMDCDPDLPDLGSVRERVLYRLGIRLADAVVAQSNFQKLSLKNYFQVNSDVLPMPCEDRSGGFLEIEKDTHCSSDEFVVGWVGRIVPLKKLELFIDAAEQLSNIKFLVAGSANKNDIYVRGLLNRMEAAENIEYLGSVPFEEMQDFYNNIDCLSSTSSVEGFPNTYLEAWSFGLPVLGIFDPDDLIRKKQLGIKISGCKDLVQAITNLSKDSTLYRELSQNSRRYYEIHHLPKNSVGKLAQVIKKILS